MADGQAPDQTQALLQMQSMISAAANGNGGPNSKTSLLAVAGLRDADVFSGLTAKGKGFNSDKPLPALISSTGGKQGGIADKFLQAIQGACDDFKKCAQNAGVMYSGNVTNGSSLSSGGSFADNSGPSVGGGMSV